MDENFIAGFDAAIKQRFMEHKEFFIKESETEVIVGFPFDVDGHLRNKCKSIFPHKFDKDTKTWRFPILIRDQVYSIFGLECPPKREKGHFFIEKPLAEFLMKHQRKCVGLATMYPKYGFFAETGTGKTLIALEILRHKQSKALIAAPLSTLETVWIDDALKFYPELKNVIINLYPFSKAEREILIKKHNGIHIINYNGFKIHFNAFISSGYKTLIIEESSILKGRTTHIAKKLIEFSQKIDSVYLLSGTPAPNTKQEFFPQIECIAPGLLGYSFHSYRNHYFHSVDRNGYNWIENTNTKQDLINRLKKTCIFISKSEAIDLPDKVFITKECEMSADQHRVYEQMKRDMVADLGEITIIKPSLLAKIMTLRQITSGFIYYKGDSLRFSDTKLNLLKETLEEIGPHQVIIWAVFQEEIKRLLSELPGSRAVYGENESQDEKNENIRDFKENKFQYLVANAASLAHGQTFINCSYTIYYSLDYSNERWLQSQDRTHRKGQVNKCTYIILLAKNSIDGIIYKALQKKEYDSKELLSHLKGGEDK